MPMTVEMSEPERVSNDVVAQTPASTNIFGSIAREVGIIDGFDQAVLPHTLDATTVEFRLDPDYVWYIVPNKTRLYCRFKIVNADNTDIVDANNKVAPVNILPAALFKTIALKCNDLAAGGSDLLNLAYKTYLEYMSTYDLGARSTHMANAFFYQDTPGKHNTLTNDNKGYEVRRLLVTDSKMCEFMFPLNLDVLNVDRLFPPGLKFHLSFTINDPKWYLMSPDAGANYKIKVEEMQVIFRKVKLNPAIQNRHERKLMTKGSYAKYPYKRNVLKKMYLNVGERTFFWQNAFSGPIPSQVFLVMNETAADLGDYTKNPFKFEDFGIERVCLNLDGKPVEHYEIDIAGNKYMKTLHAFYDNVGIQDYNGGCAIDPINFKQGCTVFSWNLIPDKRGAMFERYGSMDFHLQFKAPLTKRVSIHIWGIFDDVLKITPDKRMETVSK